MTAVPRIFPWIPAAICIRRSLKWARPGMPLRCIPQTTSATEHTILCCKGIQACGPGIQTLVSLPFLYGPWDLPSVSEGTDEIDFAEFTAWNRAGSQNVDFTVYPWTGGSGDSGYVYAPTYNVTGNPNIVTIYAIWTPFYVDFWLYSGAVPLGTVPTTSLAHGTYIPSGTTTPLNDIPQVAMPLDFALYYSSTSTTVNQQIIIQSFQYQPLPIAQE